MYAQTTGAAKSPLAASDATAKEDKKIPGVRTTINRHFRPEMKPRPGRKGRRAPPSAIAPISEDTEVEKQPEASAVELQHSEGVTGHGHGHGQIQPDALQHIGEDGEDAPDVQHKDSPEDKKVDEQDHQDEAESLDTDESDEESESELYPATAARLAAYRR